MKRTTFNDMYLEKARVFSSCGELFEEVSPNMDNTGYVRRTYSSDGICFYEVERGSCIEYWSTIDSESKLASPEKSAIASLEEQMLKLEVKLHDLYEEFNRGINRMKETSDELTGTTVMMTNLRRHMLYLEGLEHDIKECNSQLESLQREYKLM